MSRFELFLLLHTWLGLLALYVVNSLGLLSDTEGQVRHPLLRGSGWLNGTNNMRGLLGPYPGFLITLNLLAAFFPHSHSDVSMRILHAYTSLGLIPGILACVFWIQSRAFSVGIGFVFIKCLWLAINILFFCVNSWIVFNGMGIKHGDLFHLFLAAIIAVNLRLVWVLRNQPVDIRSVVGSDVWRIKN